MLYLSYGKNVRVVIVSFKSKALKIYFQDDDPSKLPTHHIQKIRLMLGRLDLATSPEMMDQPGYKYHALKGNRTGHFALWVNGNWRLTFRFEDGDAYDVDYLDYH